MLPRVVIAGIAVVAATVRPALACSPVEDYVRPTNYELVQMADAIAVATAVRAIKTKDGNALEFRIDKALKGVPPKRVVTDFAYLGDTIPSNPDDISTSHPDGHAGPCNRTTFAKGKQYVLFLTNMDGDYYELGEPFSRVNEDYHGDGSLWVRTIRTYLDIQAKFEPMEQLRVLEALLQEKIKGPRTTTTLAEAQDILDHLRSRSPWKPTAYLIQTFETLERGEVPKYGVRSRAADRENSAAQDLTDLLLGGAPPEQMSREEEMDFVLRSLVLGSHPTATPLFDRLVAVAHPRPRVLGLAIRFFAKNGQYPRAYHMIESGAVGRLAAIPSGEARRLLSDIGAAQVGEGYDYRKRNDRWRTVPEVAKAWPELALHLYWFAYHMLGDAYPSDAIREIPLKDFRARPLLSIARARGHDDAAEKWAIGELLDDAKRRAWETQKEDERWNKTDPALLPMQVLVAGFGGAKDAAMAKIACQSAERRQTLIETLGRWGGSLDSEWLAKIAAMPDISDDDRTFLAQALARLYVRQSAHERPGLLGVTSFIEYELLEQVIQRKEIVYIDKKAEPIKCRR